MKESSAAQKINFHSKSMYVLNIFLCIQLQDSYLHFWCMKEDTGANRADFIEQIYSCNSSLISMFCTKAGNTFLMLDSNGSNIKKGLKLVDIQKKLNNLFKCAVWF